MKLRQKIPFWIQVILLFFIITAPSLLRFAFQRNDWQTYTDERYGYTIEYPGHLWKRLSYAGFQGNREIHLLLYWPAGIEITHQISVGEVGMTSPTIEEVATFAEEIIREREGHIDKELETIFVNGKPALTRTYIYAGRRYKEVYIAEGGRGYFLRFTSMPTFYDSSVQDFNRDVTSFRTVNANSR